MNIVTVENQGVWSATLENIVGAKAAQSSTEKEAIFEVIKDNLTIIGSMPDTTVIKVNGVIL